jgi:hypothetical protein
MHIGTPEQAPQLTRALILAIIRAILLSTVFHTDQQITVFSAYARLILYTHAYDVHRNQYTVFPSRSLRSPKWPWPLLLSTRLLRAISLIIDDNIVRVVGLMANVHVGIMLR